MSNEFFDKHPMLGSVFDFDRNGSMSFDEAVAMGSLGTMFATEAMRASEEADHEAIKSPWDDNDFEDDDDDFDIDDDDDDEFGYLDSDDDDDDGLDDEDGYGFDADDNCPYGSEEGKIVDTTSRASVMRAVEDDFRNDADDDIERFVKEALDNGIRFTPDDIIDISYHVWDKNLLVRLISTSKPRFLQEHADMLSFRWGTVELEYHVEAFDHEYNEGNTYYVNTPEEDW